MTLPQNHELPQCHHTPQLQQLQEAVTTIVDRMARSDTSGQVNAEKVRQVHGIVTELAKVIQGNGSPGLRTSVAVLADKLDHMTTTSLTRDDVQEFRDMMAAINTRVAVVENRQGLIYKLGGVMGGAVVTLVIAGVIALVSKTFG